MLFALIPPPMQKDLKEYQAEYGNCLVPQRGGYKENTALGRWVTYQRSEYKKFCKGDKKTYIDADRIRRLESIGFAWSVGVRGRV